MAFNSKAFTAGFLNQVSSDLIQRRKEGRAYKVKLEEDAERAKAHHKKRLALVNGPLMAKYNSLKDLGATGAMINAAMASGPEGLMDFEKKLRTHSANTGIKNFTPSQITALSNMSEEELSAMEISDEQVKKNLLYSYGGGAPSLGSTEPAKGGFFSKIFGVDLESDIRANLDKDAYYQGYSKMDLIEMADQDTYESLMPDTYFSITPTKAYDPTKINEKYRDAINDANSDTLIKRLDTFQSAANYFGEVAQGLNPKMPDFMRVGGYTSEELSNLETFTQAFKRKRRYQVTQDFAGNSGGTGYGLAFLQSPTANVKSYVSPEEYNALLADNGGEEQVVQTIREAIKAKYPNDIHFTGNYSKHTSDTGFTFVMDPQTGTAIGGTNAQGKPLVLPNDVSFDDAYQAMKNQGMFSQEITGVDLPGFGSTNVVSESDLLEAGFGPAESLQAPAPTLEEQANEVSDSLNLYANPEEGKTYLVTIKGRNLNKPYRVKGEDLQYISAETLDDTVTIEEDMDPTENYKKQSGSALRRLFGTSKEVESEEEVVLESGPEFTEEDAAISVGTVPREEYESVFNDFFDSLDADQMRDKEKVMKAWDNYSKDNPSISGVLKQNIEQSLATMFSNESN
tara:strand:- start:3741 stop:5615 length:1875 start_codon:yes stop_codon:yes gene_type:complete